MRTQRQRFSKALSLSLLFHLIVILLIVWGSKNSKNPQAQKQISVEIINPAELKNKKVILEKAVQIVDQKTETNENLNATAKLLSEKNQHIKKETVALHRGEFKNFKSKSSSQKSRSLSKSQSQKSKLMKKLLPSLIPQLGMGEYKVSTLKDLKIGTLANNKGNESPTDPSNANASQTNDYLKNMDRGLQTLLNTREFKYHSYYSRIRRQLSQHWEGKVRDRVSQIYKSGRSIASNQDRITKLLVVLNSVGLLVKVQILNDSGIHDLDQAAIEAFRDAAPFPNPPRGIIESDGTVRIRWDMVLET